MPRTPPFTSTEEELLLSLIRWLINSVEESYIPAGHPGGRGSPGLPVAVRAARNGDFGIWGFGDGRAGPARTPTHPSARLARYPGSPETTDTTDTTTARSRPGTPLYSRENKGKAAEGKNK